MFYYKGRYFYILVYITAIVAAALISIWLYMNREEVDSILFSISITSLVISGLALYVAMHTFISIDSVNKITKMEGNLLDNPKYTVSLPILLDKYNHENVGDLEECMFNDLEERFKKKSKTCIEFTNNLQHFTDILALLPALFKKHQEENPCENNKRINRILEAMDARKLALESILNTGDLIQVEETIKLIKGILNYQNFVNSKEEETDMMLLKVRGSILTNGVTRTLFYNYMGLYYNKKSVKLIRDVFDSEKYDLLEIDNAKEVFQDLKSKSNKDVELIALFLKESLDSFFNALESCKNDLMWLGFIKYNIARTVFYQECLTGKLNKSIESFDDAVATRTKLNTIANQIFISNKKKIYLKDYFIYQEQLARLVRINILLATDSINEDEAKKRIDQEVENNDELYEQYKVLKKYYNQICNKISK